MKSIKISNATVSPFSPSRTVNPEGSTNNHQSANQSPVEIVDGGRLSIDGGHSTPTNEQTKPSKEVPIILDSSTNNDQSRSKGANSADLSIDPQQAGRRNSMFNRRSLSEESAIFRERFEVQLANDEYDKSTRSSLRREFSLPQTYVDGENKAIKVATDLFHLYDTNALETEEMDLSYLSPYLINSSIMHGENGDVLVTCMLEVDADPLTIITFYMDSIPKPV